MKSDYKIVKFRASVMPFVEKYRIVCGGSTISVHKDYESAQREVDLLAVDPWYHLRGQTQADRARRSL
jgi:hypothetical protein